MSKESVFCDILGCGICDLDILDKIDIPDGIVDELKDEGILSLGNIVESSFRQRAFDAQNDGYASTDSFLDRKQQIVDFLIDNYEGIQSILDDEEDIDDLLNKFTTKEMDIIDTLYENKRGDGADTIDYYINEIKKCNFDEDTELYFNFLDTHLYINEDKLEIYQLFFTDWLSDFGDAFGMYFDNI